MLHKIELPESFKIIYLTFNGQSGFEDELYDDFYSFMSLDEITQVKEDLCSNLDVFKDFKGEENERIKDLWYSEHWIPFMTTSLGDYICLDYDPNKEGDKAQIISFYNNDPERKFISKTFEEFLLKTLLNH